MRVGDRVRVVGLPTHNDWAAYEEQVGSIIRMVAWADEVAYVVRFDIDDHEHLMERTELIRT